MDGTEDPRRIRAHASHEVGDVGAGRAGGPELIGFAAGILAASASVRTIRPATPPGPPALVHRELPAEPFAWPQFGFDAAHSGSNPAEVRISPPTVARLKLRFRTLLPGVADGAPAYLSGVETAQGPRNLLYATTKAGELVAVDAGSGSVAWAAAFPPGPRYTTSSPAIDPTGTFVYSYALDGFVHRFRTSDGVEISGDGWPELATLKPDVEKGSSALALATDRAGRTFLYAAQAGYPGDQGDYQGHLTAIDLSTGAQRVFNAACSSRAIHFDASGSADTDCSHVQTAIWARPGAVYVAATDRVYVATGNGTFDGAQYWGDSVLALSPDAAALEDSYTPVEFDALDRTDSDLGSAVVAPLALSTGETLGVQGGKDGVLRVLRLSNLNGSGSPGATGGEIQRVGAPGGAEVLTAPATGPDPAGGEPWIFVANSAGVAGYQWDTASGGLLLRWSKTPGGTSPVMAGGVLFVASAALVRALDPSTGDTLWSDAGIGGVHWQSPIVAEGNVYVEDETGHLTAFSIDGK